MICGSAAVPLRCRSGGQWPQAVTSIGEPALSAWHAAAAQAFGVRLLCPEPCAAYHAALSKLLA